MTTPSIRPHLRQRVGHVSRHELLLVLELHELVAAVAGDEDLRFDATAAAAALVCICSV
jgi:hypothetical protein